MLAVLAALPQARLSPRPSSGPEPDQGQGQPLSPERKADTEALRALTKEVPVLPTDRIE